MAESIYIPDIQNYTLEFTHEGGLSITPKKIYLTKNDLIKTDVTNSTIKECVVKKGNHVISKKNNYHSILREIWRNVPFQKLRDYTTYNFKPTNQHGNKGFHWCKDISMSFQSKSSNGALKEILTLVMENKFTINLSIELQTGRIIHFKTE